MKPVLLGVVTAAVALGAVVAFQWPAESQTPPLVTDGSDALVEITVPATLSERAQTGRNIFRTACASCHGDNAVGRDGLAPPLIHRIYEPSHHGDESFQIAAAQGVRAHHWRFGNMPPVPDLTRGDVAMVIAYVREVQRANGIE